MSNEIIGIKQADGSFYPILQDGKPDNKTIELTTVRDGQTTAQIHLYKKEPGSIDEPAYVDTLLIEHLVPHPKQEPTINLNINLDENNVLTAKVVDPETGNSSDIRVSLVTVPESQLQAQSDFTVTDAEPVFAEDAEPETIDESAANKTGNFSFDMPDFDTDEFEPAEKQAEQEPTELETESQTPSEKTAEVTEPEALDDTAADTEMFADKTDDFAFDMPDFDTDEFEPAEKQAEQELTGLETESQTPSEKTAELKNDFADFGDFNLDDELSLDNSDGEQFPKEKGAEEDEDGHGALSEIPDFSEKRETADTEMSEADTMPDDTEMPAGKTDDFSFSMPDFDSDNFNTNEFDTPAEKSTESKDDSAGFDDFNLEDSDLNFDSAEDTETDFVKAQSATKENPPLYDLNLPDDIDETGGKKKCRIPMLICIICAILCILAVIGIFLRLPWKNRGGTQSADANIVTVEPPDQKVQPEDAVPPAPEENTIVIVEQEKVERQEVIPEKTEPAPEAKPQTVRYLIKWGDTLWDLSDTYYRNPWLYPIIARENKIKNPDLIIAGTYINIPPR